MFQEPSQALQNRPVLFSVMINAYLVVVSRTKDGSGQAKDREGSVSERLCNVWLDDAGDELVIVYETVKKLGIGSHVSK